MAVQNREQSIRWVIQEGGLSEADPGELWWRLSLDDLPSGLDYLMLECSFDVCPRVARGWLDQSLTNLGIGVSRVRDLNEEEVLRVSREVLAFRRRRDKMMPGWTARYQVATNRSNRVAGRLAKLIEENVYV
jgi:lysozyme family protein